jgi:hypothetical protein
MIDDLARPYKLDRAVRALLSGRAAGDVIVLQDE